ncbi:MAG: Serine/threonine-protein kinase PknH [Planctomycetota bacterium]
MTERKIGPFLVEARIGAGGMGVVYRAIHEESGREVALKVLPPGLTDDPRLLKRFEREMEILKKLSHPNIVQYFGGGLHDGQRWYAMEYIDGGSLQDLLKRRGRLTPEQTLQAARQLCSALEHAHNAGIIHRDLKPGNLFLSRKGKLKLGDFGIARDTEATALTAAGKTVGTYAYMAPEQIQGSNAISRKTDLYATGCLLFELLTGETPFTAENPAQMMVDHLQSIPFDVRSKCPECPPELSALIARLLEKDPEDRPYDALAVHTELTEIYRRLQQGITEVSSHSLKTAGVVSGTTVDPVTGAVQPPKKRRRKKRGAFYEQTWFLVTSLVLLALPVLWMLRGPGEEALYNSARDMMARGDAVAMDDARRLYLLPYLRKFPEGQYASQMTQWLTDVEVVKLDVQAEKRARAGREGRNAFEKSCVAAIRVELDETRNPLEALELYQGFLEQLAEPVAALVTSPAVQEVTAETAIENAVFWKGVAERRLSAGRSRFLKNAEKFEFLRRRMEEAEKLLVSESQPAALLIFSRFRAIFRGTAELEPWLEYARYRNDLQPAEMPVPQKATEPGV